MNQYRRQTLAEREELSRMLSSGASLRAVARQLRQIPSALVRELWRHRMSPLT